MHEYLSDADVFCHILIPVLGQVEEEMIKEWISLVVERDKLLREQLDKVQIFMLLYEKTHSSPD